MSCEKCPGEVIPQTIAGEFDSCIGRLAGRCDHYLSEHFTRLVTPDQCNACTDRPPPTPKPALRTAEEFIAEAEAKAAEKIKARLGEDIFERREALLEAWRNRRLS